jgi:hypothetical protein
VRAPDGYVQRDEGELCAVVRSDLAALPLAAWWDAGAPLLHARGRGTVVTLEPQPGLRAVARDLRRGGALGRLWSDRFLDRDRAARELAALVALAARGVSVVTPLAAVARGPGPWFRLRLVTELVEGSASLPAFVHEHPGLRRAAVRAAGALVARAFAAGLLHQDLHPDNLLLRPGHGGVEAWLLDLDRARVLPALRDAQRHAMLLRLARYLWRHRERLLVRPAATDTLRFLAGMGLDRRARRALVQVLLPRLKRQIARHRLAWWR